MKAAAQLKRRWLQCDTLKDTVVSVQLGSTLTCFVSNNFPRDGPAFEELTKTKKSHAAIQPLKKEGNVWRGG
eukprot:scaffold63883_cov39-Prasinocladus_malaysianus.AAC.1